MIVTLFGQLRGVAESLELHSANSFTLLGRRHTGGPQVTEPDSTSVLNGRAREILAALLYELLHCRSDDTVPVPSSRTILERRAFAARLSAVNCGTGPWQGGWRLERIDQDGRVVVSQDGLRLWASGTEFRTTNGAVRAGAVGELRMPAEYQCLYPGYYAALGDADTGGFPETVRVYWNLKPAGAKRFVELVTADFNGAGIPFQLKILNDPTAYHRTDAAVLYLPRERLPEASPLLSRVYQEIKLFCLDSVSHFCLQLAPGVAVAEDPLEPGTSFGLHRSRILASCFASAEVAGKSAAEQVTTVTDQLSGLGFGPARFHLNPGSPDIMLSLT